MPVPNGKPAVATEIDAAPQKGAPTRRKRSAPQGDNNKLVTMPERGVTPPRDINAKLGDIEQHIDRLDHDVSESRASFGDMLTDLKGRLEQAAAEIKQTAAQLEQSNAQFSEMAQAADGRMRVAVNDLGAQLGDAASTLEDHRTQLARLQSEQQVLDALQKELSALTDQQGSALEGLTSQQSALAQRTANLSTSMDDLAGGLAEHKTRTQKSFRTLWGLLGTVAGAVLALFVYFQYFSSAVPASVQAQLTSLNAQALSVSELQAEQTTLTERVTGLEATIGEKGNDATLAATVVGLKRTVDDLKFRIEGPSMRGAASAEPALPLHDSQWLSARDAGHYTIQLLGVYRLADVVAFINQNAEALSAQPLSYTKDQRLGRDWFNLFYGDFAGYSHAQKALDEMPLQLRGSNPWIRGMKVVQLVAAGTPASP